MEQRFLGRSGLRVPVLGFGAGTFGGHGPLFSAWGNTGVEEARSMVDLCLERGVTLFDTADAYSDGESERVLGSAIRGRREQVILSTKVSLRTGADPNAVGSSRYHLRRSVEKALQRLGTDHIDLLQLHAFDAMTPIDETLSSLDDLVRAGKLGYVGVSNFAGWQLMKTLALADRHQHSRPVAHQVYYSLIGRDYEWELMPLAQDQGVGAIVWSPLGWGRLTGKLRRGQPLPSGSRLHDTATFAPPVEQEHLYRVLDALHQIADDTGRSVPQIALNWLLQRPTVSSVLVGARNREQLQDNLGATGWQLDATHKRLLQTASAVPVPYPYYPYWNGQFSERNPVLALRDHPADDFERPG